MKISLCATLCLTLSFAAPLMGQGQATSQSARAFVQQFYNWYVPLASDHRRQAAWDSAIKEKPQAFSQELYRALKNDSDAQAKVKDDVVGLDFDPFLNTQDPCKRYEAGKVEPAGDIYRVEVFGVCSGKRNATPDIAAAVQWTNGHWEFANFFYPDQMKAYPKTANLLAMLKLLDDQRQKDAR